MCSFVLEQRMVINTDLMNLRECGNFGEFDMEAVIVRGTIKALVNS